MSFSTRLHMRFQHGGSPYITFVKCLSVSLKVILNVGAVADLKLHFPDLHVHLTSIFTVRFALGHLKLKVCASTVDTVEEQLRPVQNLQVK
jgi:hypothetical protein